MIKTKKIIGYMFVVLSAIIFGCMPLMAAQIYDEGVNVLTLVFLRNLLPLPILLGITLFKDKSIAIPKKSLPKLILISVMGCCATPTLLFASYKYIDSGISTVFHFIYPVIVTLISIFIFRNKFRIINIFSLIICVLGLLCFMQKNNSVNSLGVILALLSGVTYAIYIVLLSKLKDLKVSGFLLNFYIAAISSITMLIVCIGTNQVALPHNVRGWIFCVAFSVLITVGAVGLFQRGTIIIGCEHSSILSTLEPITSVVVGITVLGEPLSFKIVLGSLLVVLSGIIVVVHDVLHR